MRQNIFFHDHRGGNYDGADGANGADGAGDADGGGDGNGDGLNELALCSLREMFQVSVCFFFLLKSIHKQLVQLVQLEIVKFCSSSAEVTTVKAQKKIQDHMTGFWGCMIN